MDNLSKKSAHCDFICRESRDLDTESLIKLGFLVYEFDDTKIKDCPDGCRILLNDLPEDILKQMARFIQNQLELYK